MEKCELGLIGLKVMGQNLALNIAGKGFKLAVFNRTRETTHKFLEERVFGLPLKGSESLKEFVDLLKKPRKILLMVKAGEPVDEMIQALSPMLSPGDLIADCGNSFYEDTELRESRLRSKGILYMGIGVSGGEEGALKGPSIMPGGARSGWRMLKPVLERISARVKDGPCVAYIGPGGAGHFVKMVHNGLEYGEMQLIAESYDIMKRVGGLSNERIARVYQEYNRGRLAGYLMEITSKIFREKDPMGRGYLIDFILDCAHQKGTGEWTTRTALKFSEPVPTITSAVDARYISNKRQERLKASNLFPEKEVSRFGANLKKAMDDALYCSKLSLYAQGISLLRKVSEEKRYHLQISELARIWKGGCIIRSSLLGVIQKALTRNPELTNLIFDPQVKNALKQGEKNWRAVIISAIKNGIPVPAMGSALYYFDSYRSDRLPANLIQAQRDFFGAHTFERIDQPGVFHHLWTGD